MTVATVSIAEVGAVSAAEVGRVDVGAVTVITVSLADVGRVGVTDWGRFCAKSRHLTERFRPIKGHSVQGSLDLWAVQRRVLGGMARHNSD